jgi:tryptophanyl-tRNA synthetase
MSKKDIILTGDRPTGPLHLGHYVGSLANRVKLQHTHTQYVMIADMQALTDYYDNPQRVRESIFEVALDYLSVGIDPNKTTIFIQSLIPELSELTMYYLNLVTWNRLKHNPTVKAEIRQKNFNENVPAGFMVYPISQTADITGFKANIVPVGDDQIPMIEQAVEVVRKFNRLYKTDVLVEPSALTSKSSRLSGIDGKEKMSKSLNNAIYLSEEADSLIKKVKSMYTDPAHLKIEDPGKIEGNTVFAYLDIFDSDKENLEKMKAHYKRGGLGDMVVKKHLINVLENFISPIREKRKNLKKDPKHIMDLLIKGSQEARKVVCQTLKEVKQAMCINY